MSSRGGPGNRVWPSRGRSTCGRCRPGGGGSAVRVADSRSGGLRLTDVVLRAVCDTLRRHQVASIQTAIRGLAPGKRARSVLAAFARDARRALADPGSRAGQGHLGPGGLRPSRRPVVHQDHPAVAGRRRQAVGGRAVAPAPRQRRLPGSGARSTVWGCCRSTCGADPITDSTRPRWAAATWRPSSTGSPTWSRPARSAATAAT